MFHRSRTPGKKNLKKSHQLLQLNQEDGSKTRCSTGPEPPVKKSKKEPPAAAGDLKFLSWVSGKTLGSDEGFIRKLIDGKPGLKEVSTVEECDVILAFCPVVSRTGTDIESALKKLQQLSGSSCVLSLKL
ncbi:uncharacterized protein [Salminus brasiliensis]|uniref:uncharacterized protein isoform X3 n=1 Tax=Salminus brasiliensis TaxID=930266 RepID=UPI003B82D904